MKSALTLDNANAILNQASGTLTSGTININAGSYNLNGGTIANSTINIGSSGQFQTASGTLNSASFTGGDLVINGNISIQNGLVIADHNLDLANGASLYFDGPSQDVDNLNITSQGSATLYTSGPSSIGTQTLTLGSNVTVHQGITINSYQAGDTLVNNGTIDADTPYNDIYPNAQTIAVATDNFTNNGIAEATNGGNLNINSANWSNGKTGMMTSSGGMPGFIFMASSIDLGGNWSNAGTINATSGGEVTLDGTWSNTGTISATNGGTINLDGVHTTAVLSNFSVDSTSTINIAGILTNTDSTLAFNGAGAITLSGGTIVGGVIDNSAGNFTVLGGTLDGVHVTGGDLQLDGAVIVQNGLKIDDQNLDFGAGSTVNFDGPSQIIDNFNISIPNAPYYHSSITPSGPDSVGPQTLTLGSHVTVTGGVDFDNYQAGDTLINNGILDANNNAYVVTWEPMDIEVDNFTNNNIVEATYGGYLGIASANWTNSATGTISVDSSSTLDLLGGFTNAGTIKATNGSIINLDTTSTTAALGKVIGDSASTFNINGTLTNTGATLAIETFGSVTLGNSYYDILNPLIYTNSVATITGGTIDNSAGNFSVENGILNGVNVIGGDLVVNGSLVLQNGVTVANHNLDMVNNSVVVFEGPSQTLDNLDVSFVPSSAFAGGTFIQTGSVVSPIDYSPPRTLTLGSNFIVHSGITFDYPWYGNGNTLINDGTIDGASVYTANFVNNNLIEVSAGQQMTIGSSNFVNNGTIDLQGGTLNTPGGRLYVGDGVLTGAGTLNAPVLLTDDSMLAFQLRSESDFDSIEFNSGLATGGDLEITLADGFLPDSSDVFTIADASFLTGSFVNVENGGTLETSDGSGYFTVNYVDGDYLNALDGNYPSDLQYYDEIVLTDFQPGSVPEPASAGLLLTAAAGLQMRRRRNY